jgi:hypothetical protein
MSLTLTEGTDPLWPEFRAVLRLHIRDGHDAIDTVNRFLEEDRASFRVPREGLRISAELWELPRLWKLMHPGLITDRPPHSHGGAVLVLRWDNAERLIDGRKRINYWKRNNVTGPHRTLVLERQ